MNKYILLFIFLISTSISSYLPLKKDNGFDDNVCAYLFRNVNYVKTCKDKGKYCKEIGEGTSYCEDVPTIITLKELGEKCDSKYECEDGLYCYSGQCTINQNTLDNCRTSQEPHKVKNGWTCKDKVIENYCYYKDDNTYSYGRSYVPDIFKVCGEITFDSNTLPSNNGRQYFPVKIESAYIGTVEDGKFVKDVRACKSGYALPFYPDSSLKDPSSLSTSKNQMFLKCVKVNEIENLSNGCTIKYDTDQIYNINQLEQYLYPNLAVDPDPSDPSSISDYTPLLYSGSYYKHFCDGDLMTELEMFSKYISVFTKEKQEQCATKDNYNEPYTCNDNEIRKWYYYYQNPSHYNLYYKEKGDDVANYLIQKAFPLYESSRYLSNKYFISLLFLLLI